MNWRTSPLLEALREPAQMGRFGESDWELAIRQARASDLLGRLSWTARQHGGALRLSANVQRHFAAIDSIVARHRNAVHWEVRQISRALAATKSPIVLLKGAAYAASGGPAAAGRTFSDIDILVPRERLDDVENALHLHGWLSGSKSAYDIRYYRKWMHELPPMVHLHRQTTLDVHHNILPETARIRTHPELILAAAQALPGFANVQLPSDLDQILHSACHLFHEGEWAHGLRDLSDLDLMLRAYRAASGDAQTLLDRAQSLNLVVPLGYAARYAERIFETPLPDGLSARLGAMVGRRWMDALFLRAIGSAHPSFSSAGSALAESALYVRSHWLRMPLRLLLPHLLHQAFAKKDEELGA